LAVLPDFEELDLDLGLVEAVVFLGVLLPPELLPPEVPLTELLPLEEPPELLPAELPPLEVPDVLGFEPAGELNA
jgi:hypothetical protein